MDKVFHACWNKMRLYNWSKVYTLLRLCLWLFWAPPDVQTLGEGQVNWLQHPIDVGKGQLMTRHSKGWKVNLFWKRSRLSFSTFFSLFCFKSTACDPHWSRIWFSGLGTLRQTGIISFDFHCLPILRFLRPQTNRQAEGTWVISACEFWWCRCSKLRFPAASLDIGFTQGTNLGWKLWLPAAKKGIIVCNVPDYGTEEVCFRDFSSSSFREQIWAVWIHWDSIFVVCTVTLPHLQH